MLVFKQLFRFFKAHCSIDLLHDIALTVHVRSHYAYTMTQVSMTYACTAVSYELKPLLEPARTLPSLVEILFKVLARL
jgi:hypothetical protein